MNALVFALALLVFALIATAAETSADKTRQLIAVLQSAEAPFYDKARACQQLGEFGTSEAVPALAAALGDEKLTAYARSGLEGIPDPSAAAALRTAAETLKGNLLIGVVNSLGTLRDEKSVTLLTRLVGDPASGASAEALLALGRIANKDALKILRDTLTKGSDTARANAAAGLLHAAETKLALKRDSDAGDLYDAVRVAKVPAIYRAGATRGAIVARKTKGAELLVEQLRSDERIIRNAALISIRQIPSDRLAKALNAELNRAPADLQVQLLNALIYCHNAESLKVAQAKTSSDDAAVRIAALNVLGSIGGAPEAGVLLKAIVNEARPDEAAMAMTSLSRMNSAAVDQQVMKALASAPDSATRIKYIRLLERRNATTGVPDLLKCASDADSKISVASLIALKSLAGPAELPKLIAINKSAKDDAVRDAAENAIVGVSTRSAREAQGGEAALAELKQATDSALKISWIKILVTIGYTNALPEILAVTRDANSPAAKFAIEQLASWPDPTPIEPLFAIAKSASDAGLRKAAMSSAVRLATTAAEEKQRPESVIVKWFQRANDSAQTLEERRMILSGLGRVKHIESFRLLAPYLDDKTLHNEAAAAVLQIAAAVAPSDPAAVGAALQKIAANSTNQDLRNQAAKLAQSIQAKAR